MAHNTTIRFIHRHEQLAIHTQCQYGNQRHQATMLNHLIYSIRFTCVHYYYFEEEKKVFDQAYNVCVFVFIFISFNGRKKNSVHSRININVQTQYKNYCLIEEFRLFPKNEINETNQIRC